MKRLLRRHRWTVLCVAGGVLLALWIGSYVQLRRTLSIDGGSLLVLLPGKSPRALSESWRPLAEVDAWFSRKSICVYGAFTVGSHVSPLPAPESPDRFHIGTSADF